jgi:hypothetical protein
MHIYQELRQTDTRIKKQNKNTQADKQTNLVGISNQPIPNGQTDKIRLTRH